MKKILVFGSIALAALVFVNCNSAKKTTTTTAPKSTFASNVAPVIMNNCAPCHIPAKGGNKKPYDNYANVKSDIDEILRRIQLNPGERGFMPMKHPKLSDSTIAIFKKWKEDGLVEN